MTEYDLVYINFIGDKILKDPEMAHFWVNALKEHIAFLQGLIEKAQTGKNAPFQS